MIGFRRLALLCGPVLLLAAAAACGDDDGGDASPTPTPADATPTPTATEMRTPQPTLVVWGYNDPTAELKRGHALFEIIADSNPRSEMHIINAAGHFCYREQPETFNQAIKAFVEKCAGL